MRFVIYRGICSVLNTSVNLEMMAIYWVDSLEVCIPTTEFTYKELSNLFSNILKRKILVDFTVNQKVGV